MHFEHRILSLFTCIYCLLNLSVLITLMFFSYYSCNYLAKKNNTMIYYHNSFGHFVQSIKLCDDKLTWLGIITALWIAGLTIIVFILGKTNDIIYGIKFSNIISWQIGTPGIVGSGIIYILLFLWGIWSYFYGIDICIIVDILFIFIWIIGASFFVIYYSKNTNTFKAIQNNTKSRARRFCDQEINFDIDYYVRANQFPLVKMIRCLEHNDSEETKRVKKCLTEICKLFSEEEIAHQYFLLMPIISAYCEKAGFKTRHDAANITDFFHALLLHPWDEKCCLWIRMGIILPILEKWRGTNRGIDIVNILNSFPQSDRQKMIVILLLYIEYLRCCGDQGEEYITALKKLDLLHIIDMYVLNGEEETLYSFWNSWNLLDHQEIFRGDVFQNFIKDLKNWKNDEYAYQTWIFRRLAWEEWRTC